MFSSLKLQTGTSLGKQQYKKLKTILQSLLDRPQSYDFQFPVDWQGMGLTDYPFIIKNPMDLGTVSLKLKDDKYRFLQQFLDDVQLVWDNCKAYNAPGTWIFNAAQNLQRAFKKMVKNYLPNIPITIPGRTTQSQKPQQKKPSHANIFQQQDTQRPTYHDKQKLYQKLRHLQQREIGSVIEFVKNRYSECFTEQGDNAQLLLDRMQPQAFDDVMTMLIKIEQIRKQSLNELNIIQNSKETIKNIFTKEQNDFGTIYLRYLQALATDQPTINVQA